jgi:hypothetical protein
MPQPRHRQTRTGPAFDAGFFPQPSKPYNENAERHVVNDSLPNGASAWSDTFARCYETLLGRGENYHVTGFRG